MSCVEETGSVEVREVEAAGEVLEQLRLVLTASREVRRKEMENGVVVCRDREEGICLAYRSKIEEITSQRL